MKKNIKRTVVALAVLVSTLLGMSLPGLAQAAGELQRIKDAGVIRVAVFGDKPPFGYMDASGKNQGYDVYLAHRLAKDLLGDERKIRFVQVEAASRVEVLEANKVDLVLANFTVTPERSQKVDFALPYMKVMLGVVSPDKAPITDISQLKGKQLIVNKGTTADTYFIQNHPEIPLLKYDQNTTAFNALIDGRGVALAHDNTLVLAWARANPGFSVGIPALGEHDYIAPAVKKGNTELLDWLNTEITALNKEGFFHKAYYATLKDAFGPGASADTVVVEPSLQK